MPIVQLKEYQRNAVSQATRLFAQARPDAPVCVLLVAPTGAGKTVIAGRIASAVTAERPTLWFWIAPFAGVVEQAAAAVRELCPKLRVRNLATDRHLDDLASGDIYVTTWAAVAGKEDVLKVRGRTETLASLDDIVEQARDAGWQIGVVVDEAHHGFVKAKVARGLYQDILQPEVTLLVTATPDDKDVERFRVAVGLSRVDVVSVSRDDAVRAGLVKDGVKAVSFVIPPESRALRPDVAKATLRHAWKRHQDIKQMLAESGYAVTPLMLVQVDSSTDSAAAAKEVLLGLGVPDSVIAVHTAAEPDPDVLGIARDPNKEVLIFKMAVALGFDAPRAWVLASLRSSKDADFGMQLVGRVLRVEQRLQGVEVPTPLRYGYVFVGDMATQAGLVEAARKLGMLTTTRAVEGDSLSLEPTLGIDMLTEEIARVAPVSEAVQVFVAGAPGSDASHGWLPSGRAASGYQADLFGAPLEPGEYAVSSTSGSRVSTGPAFVDYARRPLPGAPVYLRVVNYPAGQNMAEKVAAYIRLDDTSLSVLSRKAQLIREEIDLWAPLGTQSVRVPTTEELDARELQRQGSRMLMFDQHIDGQDILYPHLINRLREACEERGWSDWTGSEDKLRTGVLCVLGADPRLMRDAVREALGKFGIGEDAAMPLPDVQRWPAGLPLARRCLYGARPPRLNRWEEEFVELLESDEYDNVLWWHRNTQMDKSSAYLRLPGPSDRFYPDFVVGVRGRPAPLLIDPHGEHLSDNVVKIGSCHKDYGQVLIVARDRFGVWYEQRLGAEGVAEHHRKLRPDLLAAC